MTKKELALGEPNRDVEHSGTIAPELVIPVFCLALSSMEQVLSSDGTRQGVLFKCEKVGGQSNIPPNKEDSILNRVR